MPPTLLDDHVRFRLDLPDPGVTAVVLQCDRVVGGPREFQRDAQGWVLDVPRPRLQRIEYRFAVARGGGGRCRGRPRPREPGDRPHRVRRPLGAGAAGLRAAVVARRAGGRRAGSSPHTLAGETADEVPVTVWSPADLEDEEPAPLLLVHDGPEYDQLAWAHRVQRRPRSRAGTCRRTGWPSPSP